MQQLSADIQDPVNQRILAISEDQLKGFHPDPIGEIAARADLEPDEVLERLRVMLDSGAIRRIRQTLLTTSLAPGALVAWRVPADRLGDAFDDLFENDPFSGHVVIRSTDADVAGGDFRLWTTLKTPVGFSLRKHCEYLARRIGAEAFRIMPAKKVFTLGVGHMRRRTIEPGERSDTLAEPIDVAVVELSEKQWQVLTALKREFTADELSRDLWRPRAAEIGMDVERFHEEAKALEAKRVIGRFSTFLEHIKKHKDGSVVSRYNALFHWAVPPGRELDAGGEVGRHHIMTHAYWREAGPEFNHVNVMGVAHGTDKGRVLAHKAAIDQHLTEAGIEVNYTAVFWGGRSEIKPSEITPAAYLEWCESVGVDPGSMRA